jgi:hypothetical protein
MDTANTRRIYISIFLNIFMSYSKFYRWYDEPNSLSISLESGYLKDLTERAIRKSGSIVILSKKCNLSKATIHNYKNEVGLSIGGLKALLVSLDINFNRVNNKIVVIGWNNTFFNIHFDKPEMALILAASLADGHISQRNFMYKNQNVELIQRVKSAVWEVFGSKTIIRDKIDRNGTSYILCPSFVKRQLSRLGSPMGKKLFFNPSIPTIVKEGSLELKQIFIQHFFDDEGWVETRSKRIACSQSSDTTASIPQDFLKSMALNQNNSILNIPPKLRNKIIKPRLLTDMKDILKKDFNIETNLILKKITKRKHKIQGEYVSAGWELECIKKDSYKKFHDKIGFFSSEKQKILKSHLYDKPLPEYLKQKMLNIAINLHKRRGSFTVKDIQEEIDLERGKIRKRLNTLVNHKILLNNNGEYKVNLET